MLDLKGKIFGKLKVMGFSHFRYYNKQKRDVWNCQCNCGNTTTAQSRFLFNGSKVSCGCQRKLTGNKHSTWKGVGELGLKQFNRIRNNAKTRKIFFNISIEYLWSLVEKQNKKCALSNQELSFSSGKGNASLDRIDSSQGYINGNVQWVTKDINLMKRDFSMNKFKKLISDIYDNLNSVK